jgi:predicted CDP-diglyceride synthetase/phosphatidate cytidylyltransferase
LLCVEGKITQRELVQKVTAATAEAGIAGGVITGILLAICMIFPPLSAVLGAAAIPLALAGIGFMGVRAWEIFCHADRLFAITEQTQKLLGMSEAI